MPAKVLRRQVLNQRVVGNHGDLVGHHQRGDNDHQKHRRAARGPPGAEHTGIELHHRQHDVK